MQTAGCGKPVVLVHGFGASLDHYKRNIPVLAANYKASIEGGLACLSCAPGWEANLPPKFAWDAPTALSRRAVSSCA